MRKRSIPQTTARPHAMEANAPVSWRSVFLIIVCVAVLAAGFFFAARQHFSAMEFGINNSKLREKVEELQAENRRLQLAREVVRSPGEVMKLARLRGFESRTENPVSAVQPMKVATDSSLVVKTASSEPTKTVAGPLAKPEKTNTAGVKPAVASKPVKQAETAKASRSKVDGNLIARVRYVPE